jgi:hypothetical protein
MSFNPLLAFHRKAESELLADGWGGRRPVEGRRSRTIWAADPSGRRFWTPVGSHDHRWWSEIAEDFDDSLWESDEIKPVASCLGPEGAAHYLFVLEDGFAVVETEMRDDYVITYEDSDIEDVETDWEVHRTVFDGDGSPKGNKAALWAAVSLYAYLSEGEGADKGAVWKTARQALTGGEA